jgi:hypothetical protein
MDELGSDTSTNVADLVSSFVQALYAVGRAEPTTGSPSAEDVRQLVLEFDGLPGVERDRVAGAITRLWDAFDERFDGLPGFLSAGYPERYAYLEQLEVARGRMAYSRHGAAAHYHTATAMMLAYVKSVMRQQTLESRVSEAVQRGRLLARELPPPLRDMKPQIAEGAPPVLSLVAGQRLPNVSDDNPRWGETAIG